jgi:hypothetical protein
LTAKFTEDGLAAISEKFIELTGKPPTQSDLDDLWERAATQNAHRDYGPVHRGFGDWQTKSGRPEGVDFPREFFVLW